MGKLGPGTAMGRTAIGRILMGMAVEGGTEGLQEVAQYAAERTGTQQGWDLGELLERVKPAVVLGTFVGGAGRGVGEAVAKGLGGREPGVASEAEDPGVSPAEEISALMEEEAVAEAEPTTRLVMQDWQTIADRADAGFLSEAEISAIDAEFSKEFGAPRTAAAADLMAEGLAEEGLTAWKEFRSILPDLNPADVAREKTRMQAEMLSRRSPGIETRVTLFTTPVSPAEVEAEGVVEPVPAPAPTAPGYYDQVGPPMEPPPTGIVELTEEDIITPMAEPTHAKGVGTQMAPPLIPMEAAEEVDPVIEKAFDPSKLKADVVSVEEVRPEIPEDQREVEATILESRMDAAKRAEEALTVQEATLAALEEEWGPPPIPDAAPRPASRKDKPKEKAAPEISRKEALFNAAKTQLDPTISFDVMFNEFMTFYAAAQRENRRAEAQEGVSAAANVYTERDLKEVAERQGLTEGDIQALTKRQEIGFWQTMEMVRDAGLESTVDPDGRVSVPPEMLAIIDNALSGDYNPSLIQEAALLSLTQALKKSNKRLSERSKNTKDLTELREIGRRVERGDKLLIKSLAAQIRGGSAVARVMRFRQFLVDEDMTVQDAIAKAAVMSATERETKLTEKETAKIRKLYHSADALEAEATKRIEEAKSEVAAAMKLQDGLKKKQALLKGLIEDTEGIRRAVSKRKKKKDAAKKRKEKARKKAAKKEKVAAEQGGAPILGIRWLRRQKPPGEKATPRGEAAERAIPVRVTMEGGPRKKRGKKEEGIKVAPLLKSDRQLELEREYRESQKRANDLDALAEASEEIMDEAGIPAASMSRARLDAARTELAEARKSLRDVETPAEGVVEPEGPEPSIQDIIDKNLFEARRRLDEVERMMVQAAADAEGMADKVDPERARDEAKARRDLNAIERKLKEADEALAAAAGKDVKARSDIRSAQRRKAAAAADVLHPWKAGYRWGLGTLYRHERIR